MFMNPKLVLKTSLAVAAGFWMSATLPAQANPSRELDLDLVRKFLLVSSPLINLPEMVRTPGLQNKTVSQVPWSSSFMPAVLGYAAMPSEGQSALDMLVGFPFGPSYVLFQQERLAQLRTFRHTMTELQLDTLAPAEKYDLVTVMIGTDQSLSSRLWKQAKQNDDKDGLAMWTGMCNGWSPASIIFKRPTQRIFVPSYDGRFMVPFYPEDIKQLASTLFFNTTTVEAEPNPDKFNMLGTMPMIGKRCHRAHPSKDETGLVTDPECEDVQPHLWHVSIVNLIGKFDQSFVADINPKVPVSNFPIRGYETTYFNPMTNDAGSFAASRVQRSAFHSDTFARHRSSRTRSIVGVKMKVYYTSYRLSDHEVEDSVANDKVKSFTMKYDLEMDEKGDIVSGQWGDNENQPDFIWYPSKINIGNTPTAILPSAGRYNVSRLGYTGDFDAAALGDWDPSTSLPPLWREQARQAVMVDVNILPPGANPVAYDQIRPQPLGKIIYRLIDQSNF